ncbi:MAG: flagellar biosynthesis protein FlhF [Phycisphaerales bacterium]|nr:flagellar biosynthesis protein FlhF [Phycisphaerales bacterium]
MEGTDLKPRSFKAKTMAEALDAVRRDLGAGAVIVSRSEVRGGPMGIFGCRGVEVFATGEPTGTDDDRARTIAWARDAIEQSEHVSSGMDRLRIGLHELRELVGRAVDSQQIEGPDFPLLAMASHRAILAQGLDEPLATDVIAAVAEVEAVDEATVRGLVIEELVRRLPPAAPPPRRGGGGPLVMALVGPTGVGKTTTIAKLAAMFRLQQGWRVALITADTYRIAAVDQLRTYADLVGAPIQIAATIADMRQHIAGFQQADVVLIDTAGRSRADRDRIDEMAAIVRAAEPHETHLVLSAAASRPATERAAEAFMVAGCDRAIVTKLDEAVVFGPITSTLMTLDLPLSWFTNGQEVPANISPARPRQLAESLQPQQTVV